MTRDPWSSDAEMGDIQSWFFRARAEIRVARRHAGSTPSVAYDALEGIIRAGQDNLVDDRWAAEFEEGVPRLLWHASMSQVMDGLRTMKGQYGDDFDRLVNEVYSCAWHAWRSDPRTP